MRFEGPRQFPRHSSVEDMENEGRYTHAPVSERVKSITPVEILQLTYAEARELAYNPEGWMLLEDAIDSDSYAANINASDHYQFWMCKLHGNSIVYKLHERSGGTDPIEDELEALMDRVKELSPEMREEVLPNNFRILHNLLNE